MPKARKRKLHSNIVNAFGRLQRCGGVLCRQPSISEEAKERGESYLYFVVKDNTKFPTGAGKFLIENGLCSSQKDGLFDETPQTFRAVPLPTFMEFKEQYEAAPHA